MAFDYNLFVGVWVDDDEVLYHVIQEFEDGETQVLAYGTTETPEEALKEAGKAVSEAFNV